MYDIQTILSAYDKQGTLVQWLKNLDKTLKDSGLKEITKTSTENGVILTFIFNDGNTITTPTINLEGVAGITSLSKNESLSTPGEIVLSIGLTDGTTLTSSSIEYPVNISAQTITTLSALVSVANGFNATYTASINVNGNVETSQTTIYLPIKGSESVIVDIDENNNAIEIHLDAEITAKIDRALLSPMTAPQSTELVAVDNANAQTMLSIGEGLAIENGTLKTNIIINTIELSGESGTITSEQWGKIVEDPYNVRIIRSNKEYSLKQYILGGAYYYQSIGIYNDNVARIERITINSSLAWGYEYKDLIGTPTTAPSEDSVAVVDSNNAVSYKPLSQIGGGGLTEMGIADFQTFLNDANNNLKKVFVVYNGSMGGITNPTFPLTLIYNKSVNMRYTIANPLKYLTEFKFYADTSYYVLSYTYVKYSTTDNSLVHESTTIVSSNQSNQERYNIKIYVEG